MEIRLANPRGFCAGVDRAIDIVERALELFGAPVYVRHEVVHNTYVVDCLKRKGAVFVEELSEVPDGSTVIFSAHGVSQMVRAEADSRALRVFDATCPLVTKVHMEVVRHRKNGHQIVLIGHAGHPEVEGTLGQVSDQIYLVEDEQDVAELELPDHRNLAYVTQTTLSVDDSERVIGALKKKFPNIKGPKKDDICYATQNRQDAVKQLARISEVVLVVGSRNSSNSNRLREVAEGQGARAYRVDSAEDLVESWFENVEAVGVTAGASAPEVLVKEVVEWLVKNGAVLINEQEGIEEGVHFPVPKELRI